MSRPALIVCDCERCADAFDDQIDEAVREARAFLPVGAGDEVIAERALAGIDRHFAVTKFKLGIIDAPSATSH